MKLTRKHGMYLGLGLLAGFALLAPDVAFANVKDAGEAAKNIEGNIQAIKSMIMSFFYLVGLVLVGVGLFLFYKDNKQPNQGHAKNGLVSLLVGVALLSITSIVALLTGTIGFDAKEANDRIEADAGF
ncbi:hypothetical protein [Vibrio parahaemolyticus]|uniref:hypothetical protein n=1 Tax=Vibrio parahaemolyticus TaxID=670 RepID=UPI0031CC9C5B